MLGLSDNASPKRLTFTSNMKEALSEADLVQENGPENPDSVKQLAKEENEMLLGLINQRTKGASESISAKKGDQM